MCDILFNCLCLFYSNTMHTIEPQKIRSESIAVEKTKAKLIVQKLEDYNPLFWSQLCWHIQLKT